MRFYKQPLIHFLILGGLLFAVYGWLNPESPGGDGKRIVVDEAAVLEYLQYRNQAFNPDAVQSRLAALSDSELANIKSALIREEALYREALAMGMEQNDYIIKQRLVQKMEYLARGFQDDGEAIPEAEVRAYYDANLSRYDEPATITFTHVYIDPSRHGEDQAVRHAEDTLKTLQNHNLSFADAMGQGDRFLYHVNYVERPADLIASHFGANFSQAVMALDASEARWYGPIPSDHGLHLVKVAKHTPGGIPPLAEIYDRVAQDTRQSLLQQKTDEAIQRIVESYEVVDKAVEKAAPINTGSKGSDSAVTAAR